MAVKSCIRCLSTLKDAYRLQEGAGALLYAASLVAFLQTCIIELPSVALIRQFFLPKGLGGKKIKKASPKAMPKGFPRIKRA